MLDSKDLTVLDEDKNFVETKNQITNNELKFGDVGLFFGLFLLIFIAFKDTFKMLKKK